MSYIATLLSKMDVDFAILQLTDDWLPHKEELVGLHPSGNTPLVRDQTQAGGREGHNTGNGSNEGQLLGATGDNLSLDHNNDVGMVMQDLSLGSLNVIFLEGKD